MELHNWLLSGLLGVIVVGGGLFGVVLKALLEKIIAVEIQLAGVQSTQAAFAPAVADIHAKQAADSAEIGALLKVREDHSKIAVAHVWSMEAIKQIADHHGIDVGESPSLSLK